MKKIVRILSFFFVLMLALQNANSTQDRFEYREELHQNNGRICVQHFKNAPYPSFEIPFDEGAFKPAIGTLEIEGNKHDTSFFRGWFYIEISQENYSSVQPILSTLMNFRDKGETPLLRTLAKASCKLLETCEKQNLRNPYAGRKLDENYATSCNRIPLEGELVPSENNLESGAIRLVQSLTAVYGGTLEEEGTNELRFRHGSHSVFSYEDTKISDYNAKGNHLKGDFRETDDGETANQFLKITSFESWFDTVGRAK